jgi:hypothetical protein
MIADKMRSLYSGVEVEGTARGIVSMAEQPEATRARSILPITFALIITDATHADKSCQSAYEPNQK